MCKVARPERFELPTTWFEARYSIQLSYGRTVNRLGIDRGFELEHYSQMVATHEHYPMLLAFLQLFYPTLYGRLSPHSERADIVGANLISSNNISAYRAIVFSEGVMKDGESFELYAGNAALTVYSWDWRWVFAVKILFRGDTIFPVRFQQKVIALPTGKRPLTDIFFKIIQREFEVVLENILKTSVDERTSMRESYSRYLVSVHL